MANCPRCGTALKDDYGMSQCPGCGAFSFVDMDGNAEIQNEEPAAVDSNAVDHREVAPEGGAASPSNFSDPIEGLLDVSAPVMDESTGQSLSSEFESGESAEETGSGREFASSSGDIADSSNDFLSFDPFESKPAESSARQSDEQSGDSFEAIDMSPRESASDEPVRPTSQARAEPAFGPANDPLNLNEFANSEVSSAKDGPLLFRVLISGIDTREIRESIREVLEDPRFAWDSAKLFSKISRGHVAIEGLSPVKASILVTRIKRLPVQVRWEQYAITQGQP